MAVNYIENQQFCSVDFSETLLPEGEYENCTFANCNFSNINLSNLSFSECAFTGCNLSLAKLSGTAFKDIAFKNCKMLGLRFEDCSKFCFAVSFDNCMLDHSTFYQVKLKNTLFRDCKLIEVDFSDTDIAGSLFNNCDLTRAVFDNTNLEKTDFRTSYNFIIAPSKNKIRKAKFSLQGIPGLLAEYDIEIED